MSRAARLGLSALLMLAAAVAAAGWIISSHRLPAGELSAPHEANLANGRTLFLAGDCSACHMTKGQDDRLKLGGGRELRSAYGVFVPPNISPDRRHGIGAWSEAEFVDAMKRGVGRHGEHLYPAFPYVAYSRMRTADVRDLFAYLKTLPSVDVPSAPHRLRFPYGLRPLIGGWKLLYFRPAEWTPDPARSARWNRGAYLVEASAHCAECHTPRDGFGGLRQDQRFAGAPNLEPGGRFATNITPHADGLKDWSAEDLAAFLKSGQDKCFNEPTGMAEVVAGASQLSDEDLAAIAAYVTSLPPKPGNAARRVC